MSIELQEPTCCDACASFNVRFEEYRKSQSAWPFVWYCGDCKALVHTHAGTRKPTGRMALKKTRELRAKAHEAFDPIWREYRLFSRSAAYGWLARQLGISENECHFSLMYDTQLIAAIAFASMYLTNNAHKADKRQKKRHEQKRRSIQAERNAINRRRNGS